MNEQQRQSNSDNPHTKQHLAGRRGAAASYRTFIAIAMESTVFFANFGVRAFSDFTAGLGCAARGVVLTHRGSSAVAQVATSASCRARTVFARRNRAAARRGTFVAVAMESCVLISDLSVGAFLEFATGAARAAVAGIIISCFGSSTVSKGALASPSSPRLVLSLFKR